MRPHPGGSRDDAVRGVLAAMAGDIAAGAPDGWRRGELRGYVGWPAGAGQHRVFRFEPARPDEAHDIDVFDGMRTLHALTRAADHLTVELELESHGRYHAVLSERLDRAGDRNFRYLFDPGWEPPEPGDPTEPGGPNHAGGPDEVGGAAGVGGLAGGFRWRVGNGPGIEVDDPEGSGDPGMLEVTGPDAAPVRGMRMGIRELAVRNAPRVDLGPVRGASTLRRLRVRNCPGADLSPLRHTAVEELYLAMDAIDLAGLEGHPAVRKVILHGAEPVDLRPLPSCPRLYALDLADATALDISVLGRCSALRYLRMRRTQWERLRTDGAVPAWLAVAELAAEPLRERRLYWSFDRAYRTPRPTLRDAVSWARTLPGDTTDVRTFRGRFTPTRHR